MTKYGKYEPKIDGAVVILCNNINTEVECSKTNKMVEQDGYT